MHPGRRAMTWWNGTRIRLYERAASLCDFHARLADMIKQHIAPADTVLEAGCGLGYITALLQERGINVTGCDSDSKAIEEAMRLFPSCTFICTDISLVKEPYDILLCVFFGRIREDDNFDRLFRLCRKRMIYIVNEHEDFSLSSFSHSSSVAAFLDERKISYSFSAQHLRFDQPLKDETELDQDIRETYTERGKSFARKIQRGKSAWPMTLVDSNAVGFFVIEK